MTFYFKRLSAAYKNGTEYFHGLKDVFIGRLGVLILSLNTACVNITGGI